MGGGRDCVSWQMIYPLILLLVLLLLPQFDSAWTATNPINVKFENKGGGTKQVFERPLHKKRKIG